MLYFATHVLPLDIIKTKKNRFEANHNFDVDRICLHTNPHTLTTDENRRASCFASGVFYNTDNCFFEKLNNDFLIYRIPDSILCVCEKVKAYYSRNTLQFCRFFFWQTVVRSERQRNEVVNYLIFVHTNDSCHHVSACSLLSRSTPRVLSVRLVFNAITCISFNVSFPDHELYFEVVF